MAGTGTAGNLTSDAHLAALAIGRPVVRAVGGLVNTVFDKDYSDKPLDERNGFVFHQSDTSALESALHRAIGLWYSYPDHFQALMLNGMRYDFSWNHPGQHYLNIYDYIREK